MRFNLFIAFRYLFGFIELYIKKSNKEKSKKFLKKLKLLLTEILCYFDSLSILEAKQFIKKATSDSYIDETLFKMLSSFYQLGENENSFDLCLESINLNRKIHLKIQFIFVKNILF